MMDWTRTISNSERQIAGCLHKWFLRYGLGLAIPHKGVKMYVGTVWHEALELYAKEGLIRALNALGDIQRAHIGGHADTDAPGKIKVSSQHFPEEIEEINETFDLVRSILRRYHEHWSTEDGDAFGTWTILETEHRVEAWVRTPNGGRSTATGYMGKMDRVLLLEPDQPELGGGQWLYIGESKSTSMLLEKWWEVNEYKVQALTYAWLLRETTGKAVRGVLFDLAFTKPPRPASDFGAIVPKPPRPSSDFTTIASGKQMRSTSSIPHTTSANWLEAIEREGFELEEPRGEGGDRKTPMLDTYNALVEREKAGFWLGRMKATGGVPSTTAANWLQAITDNGFVLEDPYTPAEEAAAMAPGVDLKKLHKKPMLDTYNALVNREQHGYWFQRRRISFTEREIDRAGAELYHVGTQLRRLKIKCNEIRESLKEEAGDPSRLADAVAAACHEHGDYYPRNFSMCRLYNRPCSMMELCRHQTREAAGRYVLRERSEIIEEDENEEADG